MTVNLQGAMDLIQNLQSLEKLRADEDLQSLITDEKDLADKLFFLIFEKEMQV